MLYIQIYTIYVLTIKKEKVNLYDIWKIRKIENLVSEMNLFFSKKN
jgi:hypothetical protein